MKITQDSNYQAIEFESSEEMKSFKRILRHAEADFEQNFSHFHLSEQLKNDYNLLKQLLCEL